MEGDDLDVAGEIRDLEESHFLTLFGENELRRFHEAGDYGLHGPKLLFCILDGRFLVLEFVFVLIEWMPGNVETEEFFFPRKLLVERRLGSGRQLQRRGATCAEHSRGKERALIGRCSCLFAMKAQQEFNICHQLSTLTKIVECPTHDKRLERFFVQVLVGDTRKEIGDVGELPVCVARRDDRIGNSCAKIFYAVESEADVSARTPSTR